MVYQIYIRSIADGNGDGIGDIAGIRQYLPYRRDLGVEALWITPWYVSPMADGGYDVADYRNVDPMAPEQPDLNWDNPEVFHGQRREHAGPRCRGLVRESN